MRTTIKSNNSGASNNSWVNTMAVDSSPMKGNGMERMRSSGGGSREKGDQKRVLNHAAGRKKRINAS